MYNRVLQVIQEKIRTRQYVMTLHAEEEMNNDELTIFDVEHGILTGHIIERQRDQHTDEWKYLIQGRISAKKRVVVVAKINHVKKLVIITVYLV